MVLVIVGVLGLIFDISWMLTGGLEYLGLQGLLIAMMGIVVSVSMIGTGLRMTGLGGQGGSSSGISTHHTPQLSSGGWFADPTGRHDKRYWDGSAWTSRVEDGGTQGEDPIG